jgi:hypothetical protein
MIIAGILLAASLGTRAFCEAFEGAGCKQLAHQCLELVNSGLASKHVKMDHAAAVKCVAARQAFVRDPRRGVAARAAMVAACTATLRGMQQKDQPCESALECAGDLVCAGKDGGPPGKCVAPLAAGSNCSADPVNASAVGVLFATVKTVCGAGSHCAGTTCAADSKTDCRNDDAAACGPGHRCVQSRCVEDRLGMAGDACNTSADCVGGAACAANKCASPAKAGGDDLCGVK